MKRERVGDCAPDPKTSQGDPPMQTVTRLEWRDPDGVPDEFWDLADYRTPFLAYGGPRQYVRAFERSLDVHGRLNDAAAVLICTYPADEWQDIQQRIVAHGKKFGWKSAHSWCIEQLGGWQ